MARRRYARWSALPLVLLLPLAARGADLPAGRGADPPSAAAQVAAPAVRMAALARLWGEVRYRHPHLPYLNVDWDAALLAALPGAASQRPEDLGAAAQAMLATLKDPATRVLRPPKRAAAAPPPPPLTRLGAVLAVRLVDPGLVDDADRLEALFAEVRRELGTAHAVVFDLRLPAPARDPAVVKGALEGLGGLLAPRPLPAPAQHYLMHAGLRGSGDGDSAYSAYVTEFAGSYAPAGTRGSGAGGAVGAPTGARGSGAGGAVGAPTGVRRRVVFLVNQHAPIPPLALALQRAEAAFLLSEGPLSDESLVRVLAVPLGEGLVAQVRTSDLVFPDGTSGIRADLELPPPAAGPDLGWQRALAVARATLDPPHRKGRLASPHLPSLYATAAAPVEDGLPAPGRRLLALFRLWNAVRLFHPARAQLGPSFDAALPSYVERIQAAGTAADYALCLAELLALLPDENARLSGSPTLAATLGPATPPLLVQLVEGAPVIRALRDGPLARQAGVAVGDVIQVLDGEDPSRRIERLAHLLPAGTPAARQRVVADRLLGGADGSQVTLVLRDAQGHMKTARLVRHRTSGAEGPDDAGGGNATGGSTGGSATAGAGGSTGGSATAGAGGSTGERSRRAWSLLAERIGYLDLTRLSQAEQETAFAALRGSRGLVLDLRGVPREPSLRILSRVKGRGPRSGAVLEQAQILGAEPEAQAALHLRETVPEPEDPFSGPVAVLIDERTAGDGEALALLLRSAGARLVGSPSAGTPSEAVHLDLPGGLRAWFSSAGLRDADGARVHGQGLSPDTVARVTLAGIRAGRDEVLERALTLLAR